MTDTRSPTVKAVMDLEDVKGEFVSTWEDAKDIVLCVLDALMGDPGHDATSAVVSPTEDRTVALAIWNKMLTAVRDEVASNPQRFSEPPASDTPPSPIFREGDWVWSGVLVRSLS